MTVVRDGRGAAAARVAVAGRGGLIVVSECADQIARPRVGPVGCDPRGGDGRAGADRDDFLRRGLERAGVALNIARESGAWSWTACSHDRQGLWTTIWKPAGSMSRLQSRSTS